MEKDVIKYHTCLLMAIGLLAAASSMAQVGSNKLKKQVTVFRNEIRVDSFLNLLAKQTGIGFSFNSKKISPAKVITLKKGVYTVEECLLKIQQTAGIHYALISNNIILVDNPPQEKYRLQLSQKKTVTTATVKSSTPTTVKKSSPSKPVTTKGTVISQPVTTKNVASSESLTTQTDLAGRSAQTIQKAIADTTTIQTGKSVFTDSMPLTAGHLTTATIRQMRPSRRAIARAAQAAEAAQSTAGAGRSRRDRSDRDKDWGLIAGASLLRPDFSGGDLGLGAHVQYEKKFSNKWSWTGSLGYNYIMGNYIGDSVQIDTAIFRPGDTVKHFAHIPALLGLRYYVFNSVYLSFETGYSIKADNVSASCLTFSPAVGIQLPVGNGAIDVNVNYLWLKEKMTYPEKPRLQQGGLGFWCLRVGWVF